MESNDYVREYLKAIENPLRELKTTFEAELKFLKSCCNKSSTILDIGCGAARPATDLSHNVNKIVCIDNDKNMIELAKNRSKNIGNIDVFEMNALNLKFQENSFDLVYDTYNLLGSLDGKDRQKLIDEMARVTKKNGMITNITWKEGTVTTKFLEKYYPSIGIQIISINDLGTVTSKGEFTRFTKKQLKRYYEKSGLKDIEFFDIGSVWMAIRGVK